MEEEEKVKKDKKKEERRQIGGRGQSKKSRLVFDL